MDLWFVSLPLWQQFALLLLWVLGLISVMIWGLVFLFWLDGPFPSDSPTIYSPTRKERI